MKSLKVLLITVILFAFVLPLNIYAVNNEDKVMAIVSFKKNTNQELLKSQNIKIKKAYRNFSIVVAELTEQQIKKLKKRKDVESVEIDGVWSANTQVLPWGVDHIDADVAQVNGYTGKGIKIGVLDSGSAPHEDLLVSGGWNFINNTSGYQDDFGHGTHIAGIISAINNDLGVIGVAPDVNIYSLKVLDNQGNANWSSIISAIDWAISNKLNILNMSFSGTTGSKSVEKALKKAYNSGVLLVAASGNMGSKNKDNVTYPAKYNTVIAVGAVNSDNTLASFSSTGTSLELVAPGVNIYSTYLQNTYKYASGTSMAAPHVTGVAALVWSQNPTWTNIQIRDKLISSTLDLGTPGFDSKYGYGLVNAPN